MGGKGRYAQAKKPGFLDKFMPLTDMFDKNPVSESQAYAHLLPKGDRPKPMY